MSLHANDTPEHYTPDHRLSQAYDEATLLDDAGIEALCPSYIELAEVNARYRDDEVIGQGAFKDVYRTYDSRTKRWIAMARLLPDRGPEYYDLFVHEAWLTSSLNHPNVINVHDTGVDSMGRPFFTMDLKSNTSLADVVKNPQRNDRRQLLEIFTKICDAVAYAHSRNVIHLDLKPDNIQSSDFGEVLVCDWGLGKMIGAIEEGEEAIPQSLNPCDNMTLLGQIKGTPGYMAPEQVIPKSTRDVRTDIFSLGCILHFILTGHPPHTGPMKKVLDATTQADITPPQVRYPHLAIPDSLQAVVMKATTRNPDERYQSALTLQKEIFNYLKGYSTKAEQPSFLREARLFIRRNRTSAAITALALIVLTIVTVLSIQGSRYQKKSTAEERVRASLAEYEANKMATLYQDQLAQVEDQRIAFARELATSSNNLKNLGIFKHPARTVRDAKKLNSSALILDPNCAVAKFETFSLNCISLNFQEALSQPISTVHRHASYLRYAEAFPHFNFTEHRRPTTKQIATFFRTAHAINPDNAPLMERILFYDFATRKNHSSSAEILEAFLEYLNGEKEHLRVSYDRENSSYSLWSSEAPQLLVPFGSGSGACALRLIHFRTLNLNIPRKFDVAELQKLPIEILNARNCDELFLSKNVSLPRLREIHIRPGQIEENLLRSHIQTTESLRIIATP